MAASSSARNTLLVEVGHARCEAEVGGACGEVARGSSSDLTRSGSIGERFPIRLPSRIGRSVSEMKTFTGYPYRNGTYYYCWEERYSLRVSFGPMARRRRSRHRSLSLHAVT